MDPNENGGKQVTSIPIGSLRRQVNAHLVGKVVRSPFSSWSADWQTAIYYAGIGSSAHIAIMDTSLKRQHTHIWHVTSLVKAGITGSNYFHEYLVYGPVHGEAYVACRSISELRKQVESHSIYLGASFFSSAPAIGSINSIRGLVEQAHFTATAFSPHNSARLRPDMYLTILAAEMARHRTHEFISYGVPLPADQLTLLEKRSIQSFVGPIRIFRWAAKYPSEKALFNPLTYSDGLPQLKAMIKILQFFESEIAKESDKRLQKAKAKSEHAANGFVTSTATPRCVHC